MERSSPCSRSRSNRPWTRRAHGPLCGTSGDIGTGRICCLRKRSPGSWPDSKTFLEVLATSEDMISLRVIAKDEHPDKPYILLGHSMGSFAAQQFVLDHSHSIDGLVLSGSGTLDGLARLAQSVPAGEDPMKFMNAPFEPARTPSDWLVGTMRKWMPSSPIRSAFRRLRLGRWSLSWTHSRGLPIRECD